MTDETEIARDGKEILKKEDTKGIKKKKKQREG
jgi:hypothetical protein